MILWKIQKKTFGKLNETKHSYIQSNVTRQKCYVEKGKNKPQTGQGFGNQTQMHVFYYCQLCCWLLQQHFLLIPPHGCEFEPQLGMLLLLLLFQGFQLRSHANYDSFQHARATKNVKGFTNIKKSCSKSIYILYLMLLSKVAVSLLGFSYNMENHL